MFRMIALDPDYEPGWRPPRPAQPAPPKSHLYYALYLVLSMVMSALIVWAMDDGVLKPLVFLG